MGQFRSCCARISDRYLTYVATEFACTRAGGNGILTVCLVHNFYREPGGEDQAFIAEGQLLEDHGHRVLRYTAENTSLDGANRVAVAAGTIWNRHAHQELSRLFAAERPDVVHFHNTLPLISPSAYYAAQAAGAAVVQTLHNYRMICPGSLLYRDGRVCEDCIGKKSLRWPGVVHACYRDSRLASGVVASMLAIHQAAGTWHRSVNTYIALTEFARQKLVEGGVPESKLTVKPNFLLDDPGLGSGDGSFALFVGRLVPEKGIKTLIDGWTDHPVGVPLKIVGGGPLAGWVEEQSRLTDQIHYLGQLPNSSVRELMKRATVLVFPSEWYEALPITIIEGLATGLPIVASKVGGLESLVLDGECGLLFPPGNPSAMVARVQDVVQDASMRERMRSGARAQFEAHYGPAHNYQMLNAIYARAIADAHPAAKTVPS